MKYPGNAGLAPDLQQRLQETYLQSRQLAASGRGQEAILGCEFILQLDPHHEPARELLAQLEAGGAVTLDAEPPGEVAAVPDYGVTDRFLADDGADLALPPLSEDEGLGSELSFADLGGIEERGVGPAAGSDLDRAFQQYLAQRRFRELLELAGAHGAELGRRPELRQMAEEAQSLLEAEPYVERFLDGARQALQAGEPAEADRLLAKARALDAGHPGIADLENAKTQPAEPQEPTFALGDELPELSLADLEEGDAAFGGDDTSFAELGDGPRATASLSSAAALGGFGAISLEDETTAPKAPGRPPSESDQRIADLLQEGQSAFDGGDYQGAIDSWSRIFLIDIDHPDAARRIEQARKMKAEGERRAEESFHEGLDALERADPAAAKAAFRLALADQPSHAAARDYLQQLEAGRTPAPPPRGREAAAPTLSLDELGDEELKEEILVPPEPGAPPRKGAREPAAPLVSAKRARPLRTFAAVGGLVLLVALAAGWFVLSRRESLFPNSAPPPAEAVAPAARPLDALARARKMYGEGKAASAIATLKRIPPASPQYREAKPLIAAWEAELAQPVEPTLPPEQLGERDAIVALARQAFDLGELLRARELLERAAAVHPLEAADEDLRATVEQRLAPLEREIGLVREREYERALPALWRLREREPGNRDVRKLLVDSYYQLALRDLQRGYAREAAEKLSEALALSPDDVGMRRTYLFAQSYSGRAPDLLYRTYVKYLPSR